MKTLAKIAMPPRRSLAEVSRSQSRTRLNAVALLICVDALLTALHVGSELVLGAPPKLFDLSAEANIPTWWSSAQLLVAGLVLGAVALRNYRVEPRSWAVAGFSLVLIAMSLDETACFHERLGNLLDLVLDRSKTIFPETGSWALVLGGPAVLAIGYLLYLCADFVAKVAGCLHLFVLGLVLLFGGAVGFELLNNWTSADIGGVFEVTEETLEMLGGSVLVWAAWRLIQRHPATEEAMRALRPL